MFKRITDWSPKAWGENQAGEVGHRDLWEDI